MSLGEQLPLAEVKNRLSEVVEREETLRILSDPDLLAQVRTSRGERALAAPLTEEAAARLIAPGQ